MISILDEHEEELLELHHAGYSKDAITRTLNLNVDRETIRRWFLKKGLEFKHIKISTLDSQRDKLLYMYNKGFNCARISEAVGQKRLTVLNWFKINGMNFSHIPNTISDYSEDESFFEIIDTQEKAYLLGLFYSDGTVCNNRIILSMTDEDIIIKAKHALSYTGPILNVKPQRKAAKWQYKIDISSAKLVADIKDKGCIERKSLTIKWPTPSQVPIELLPHWIRGEYDGDGSIYWHIRAKKYYINITGTCELCEGFKCYFGFGSVRKIGNKESNTYQWCVYDMLKIRKFLETIYKDATIYLDRKKEKADLCLNSTLS